MNIWHDIPKSCVTPQDFTAVIEIPKGGKNKYEMDKETGLLRLDRVLYTATHYPANYGFIPRTYADDGDPLDVLVLCQESIVPMTLVQCHPIGVIKMVDSEAVDEKIVAVPTRDPSFSCFRDISELPVHTMEEMEHFFSVYKNLEHNKETRVEKAEGREEAVRIIIHCMEEYRRHFCGERD
ncbi:MAG: inorganic diphosphatase [Clostridia bacterium]|nr:inorganic diphosphatase [Clostridia bacterium]